MIGFLLTTLEDDWIRGGEKEGLELSDRCEYSREGHRAHES